MQGLPDIHTLRTDDKGPSYIFTDWLVASHWLHCFIHLEKFGKHRVRSMFLPRNDNNLQQLTAEDESKVER